MSKDIVINSDALLSIQNLKKSLGTIDDMAVITGIKRSTLGHLLSKSPKRMRKDTYYKLLPHILPFLTDELQLNNIDASHRELLSVADFAGFPAVVATPEGVVLTYTAGLIRLVKNLHESINDLITANAFVGKSVTWLLLLDEIGGDREELLCDYGTLKTYHLPNGEVLFIVKPTANARENGELF